MGMTLRTVAAIGPDDHRLELLVEAVSVLGRSPSLLARGHALFDLGAAQRRSGQITAARTPLREALQLAHEMGATVLEASARHELHATGARPRRAARSGADALTPTERRVAELAAQGLSNPQIAQALFVTSKTIQTHLAHAYRKLDIRSRHHLAHALSVTGPPTTA
jgi:DNA-binding CsgD family transcriptional regulator